MATKKATTAPDRATLLDWVKETDRRSQHCHERIEAFVEGIKAILKVKEIRPADLMVVATLCDEVSDTAFTLMNEINSEAEDFGVNYSDRVRVSHG